MDIKLFVVDVPGRVIILSLDPYCLSQLSQARVVFLLAQIRFLSAVAESVALISSEKTSDRRHNDRADTLLGFSLEELLPLLILLELLSNFFFFQS